MTVRELYERIGGNYDEATSRLMNDALIGKFIVKFLDDTSYAQLMEGVEAADDEAIFRAAHTMKGVCGNLALTELFETSGQLTECYRAGNEDIKAKTDVDALVEKLKEQYAKAIEGIKAFEEQ